MKKEYSKEEIIKWASSNKKRLKAKYFNLSEYQINEDEPIVVFMAGSPGAGKTETSREFASDIVRDSGQKVLRIDPDEIRDDFREIGYDGKNSFLYQAGTAGIVNNIVDEALRKRTSFILDGTFSKEEKAIDNIERCLNKNCKVYIFYIYQDPIQAWEFVRQRELKEGRRVEKSIFIEQYFMSRNVVNKMKNKFKERVNVFLLKKNIKDEAPSFLQINDENLDVHIKESYTREVLEKML